MDRFEEFKEFIEQNEYSFGLNVEEIIYRFEECKKEEEKIKAKKERLEVIEKLCVQLKQRACFYPNIEIDVDHIWDYEPVHRYMRYVPAAKLIGDKITIKFTGD